MAPRPCIQPGCPQLVRSGSRCPDHARPGTTARGYGSSWQALSLQAREIQPWCTDCGAEDDLTVDHLHWPAHSLDDVEVVCRGCNNRRGKLRRFFD
ncbi:hypothetical protein [Tessaracoccus sp. Y1736]